MHNYFIYYNFITILNKVILQCMQYLRCGTLIFFISDLLILNCENFKYNDFKNVKWGLAKVKHTTVLKITIDIHSEEWHVSFIFILKVFILTLYGKFLVTGNNKYFYWVY